MMLFRNLIIICIFFIGSIAAADELSRGAEVSYKVSGEAYYYEGQVVKGTKQKVKKLVCTRFSSWG